ncbi:hypothetical protein C5C57_14820 [Rathayibacter sp. AY1C5]|nr:hypothetical protein C5C57_14820 [Rathayibacter sp. AY1C5]
MFPELGTAFLAGALALLSPCAAPILPGIVGALTSTGDGRARPSRQVWSILAFAVGAALVLIGSVALLLAFGANVNLARPPYTFIAGGLLIAAGLYSLGVLRIPWMVPLPRPVPRHRLRPRLQHRHRGTRRRAGVRLLPRHAHSIVPARTRPRPRSTLTPLDTPHRRLRQQGRRRAPHRDRRPRHHRTLELRVAVDRGQLKLVSHPLTFGWEVSHWAIPKRNG